MVKIRISVLLFLTFSVCLTGLFGQSSKSKSKEVIYQKPGEIAQVSIRNQTSINSPNTDFSPAYYQNGLVYVSSKRNAGPRDKKTNETFFELYFAPFDPNQEPANAQQFSININSSKHEGPVTFSRDWQTMYFTRNNMENGVQKPDHKGVVHLKIYEAKRGKYDWGSVRELPFNSDNFSCMHPTLSADGNVLYFSSDKEGGEGGFDLYKVTKTASGWSNPINLGPEINTDRNEVFPFIHAGGDLFFSTSGHNSMGGLDIFVVKKSGLGNVKVANLGEPFNSEADDLGIIMDDAAATGFFASSRKSGYGKDDIYSFKINGGIKTVAPLRPERIKMKVVDDNGRPVQGAAVRVLKATEDGYINEQGDFYRLDFQPLENNANSLAVKLVRKEADKLGHPQNYTNAKGESDYDFQPYEHYIIIANTDKGQVAEKLFSLTENKDGRFFTLQLPQPPTCVNANGMVVYEQFGKRLENCKIRFTHKRTAKQTTVVSDKNGEFEVCLPLTGEYMYRVEKEGFNDENLTCTVERGQPNFIEVRMRTDNSSSSATALRTEEPIQEGSRLVITDIYYDFNQATLNESGVGYMEGLLQLLINHPSMEIDLISHTDSQGTSEHNMELSNKRAENAKGYLVYRGIKADRIRAIGKGETEIQNRCTDGVNCSDEEHQFNRRTEIVVRKFD